MKQPSLSPEERNLLLDLLESEISELRMEISITDRNDFKQMLKEREAMTKKLQKDLEEAK